MKRLDVVVGVLVLLVLPIDAFAGTAVSQDVEHGIAIERTNVESSRLEKERSASELNKTVPNCVRDQPTISPEGEPSLHNLSLCAQQDIALTLA